MGKLHKRSQIENNLQLKDKDKHSWEKTKTIKLKRRNTMADTNNKRDKIKED